MEIEKYTKVVYETKPIGKEGIVLVLTTFDMEAFEKDQKLKQIPIKKEAHYFDINTFDKREPYKIIDEIDKRLEDIVNKTYKEQIEAMKNYIEYNRKLPEVQCYRIDD